MIKTNTRHLFSEMDIIHTAEGSPYANYAYKMFKIYEDILKQPFDLTGAAWMDVMVEKHSMNLWAVYAEGPLTGDFEAFQIVVDPTDIRSATIDALEMRIGNEDTEAIEAFVAEYCEGNNAEKWFTDGLVFFLWQPGEIGGLYSIHEISLRGEPLKYQPNIFWEKKGNYERFKLQYTSGMYFVTKSGIDTVMDIVVETPNLMMPAQHEQIRIEVKKKLSDMGFWM